MIPEILHELRGFYELRLEATKTSGEQSRTIAKELAEICKQVAAKSQIALPSQEASQ